MSARGTGWSFVLPAKAWLGLFYFVPLAGILIISFWRVVDYQLVPDASIGNYVKAAQPLYLNILARTFAIAVIVTAIAAAIGYPVAYFIAFKASRFRYVLLTLVTLPLWTSYLVRAFAWMVLLGANGVINYVLITLGIVDQPIRWLLYSEVAVITALVHIYVPFFVLPVYSVLDKVDRRLLEASRDLGASSARTFWSVTFPLSLPGVATGCLFVFIPAAGSYVSPELLGGPNVIMIGSVIAQQFGLVFEYPFGSTLALMLLAGILLGSTVLIRSLRVRGLS